MSDEAESTVPEKYKKVVENEVIEDALQTLASPEVFLYGLASRFRYHILKQEEEITRLKERNKKLENLRTATRSFYTAYHTKGEMPWVDIAMEHKLDKALALCDEQSEKQDG